MKKVNIENLRVFRDNLEEQLEPLQKQIDIIQDDMAWVDRMLQRYGGQESLPINDKIVPNTLREFEKLNLRESVRIILKRHDPKSVRVSILKEEVLTGGYKTASSNLPAAIFGILAKLIKAGEVKKVGKGRFKII